MNFQILQQNDGKSRFYELSYFSSKHVSLSVTGTREECLKAVNHPTKCLAVDWNHYGFSAREASKYQTKMLRFTLKGPGLFGLFDFPLELLVSHVNSCLAGSIV